MNFYFMVPIANALYYVSIFSVLLPIIFLLKKKQNFKIAFIKIFGMLLFISAFSDWGGYILIKLGKSNISIINTYTLIEFFLLSCIYYLLLKNKKNVYIALVIFIIFFIINIIFIQPFSEFQNWTLVLESVIIFIYSIKYYLKLYNIPMASLFRFHLFWLNTAIFYYFGASILIFLCSNYILKNMSAEMGIEIWMFHNFNSIIKNILFTVAICYVGAKQDEAYDGRNMSHI
ncbi:MAG: hypothetical protein IPJ81_02845 [Chitinophagaceae bacterium]|nr:hypothetical protein [Chitinophagaceae bacterium]